MKQDKPAWREHRQWRQRRAERRRYSDHPRPYHRGSIRGGRRRPLDREQRAQVRGRMENHFRHKRLTAADAFVCVAILSMVNHRDGSCFPSYAAIAELAGVGKTAVWSAIKKLRELGLLDWDMRITLHADGRHCQTSNAYVFVVVVRVPWPSTNLLLSLLKTLDSYFTPQRAEPETKLPAELAGVPPGLAAALASLGRTMQADRERKES